jgi:hypothetical protein
VLLLQRWSGRSWVTKARVRQDIAQASHSVTFSRRGTSRWRWHLVANERCRAASSLTVKVVVK